MVGLSAQRRGAAAPDSRGPSPPSLTGSGTDLLPRAPAQAPSMDLDILAYEVVHPLPDLAPHDLRDLLCFLQDLRDHLAALLRRLALRDALLHWASLSSSSTPELLQAIQLLDALVLQPGSGGAGSSLATPPCPQSRGIPAVLSWFQGLANPTSTHVHAYHAILSAHQVLNSTRKKSLKRKAETAFVEVVGAATSFLGSQLPREIVVPDSDCFGVPEFCVNEQGVKFWDSEDDFGW